MKLFVKGERSCGEWIMESTQKLIDAYRIHYNFIRNHGSIGQTPAEQAGIKLDLGQNKIETLIKLASRESR